MLNVFFPLFIHSAQHPPPTPACHLLYRRCLTISNQTFRSEFPLMKSSIFAPHHFPRWSLQKLPICHAMSVCLFNKFQLQYWFSNYESNAQALPSVEILWRFCWMKEPHPWLYIKSLLTCRDLWQVASSCLFAEDKPSNGTPLKTDPSAKKSWVCSFLMALYRFLPHRPQQLQTQPASA